MNYDAERLERIRKQLNTVSDKLGEEIKKFEEGLQKLNLGIRVLIPLVDSKMKLGYEKWTDGKWHIIVVYANHAGDEIINTLLDAPRHIRLFGFKHRLELIPAMIEAAESLTQRIEKALENAEKYEQENKIDAMKLRVDEEGFEREKDAQSK
jgi:hypothetical protein